MTPPPSHLAQNADTGDRRYPGGQRRPPGKHILLDRALEALPLFRLSDSAEEASILYTPPAGGRWRVLPSPGDRLPGTFDQDVYVEICRRYLDAGSPPDGAISFTLHAFLRSIGRRADGRTYEQLRAALSRLERTTLESAAAYVAAGARSPLDGRFTVLSAVSIDRRRVADREQLALFPNVTTSEPGDARVTLSPTLRQNMAAGYVTTLVAAQYQALQSPVARRLYRLLEVARAEDTVTWRIELEALAELMPLVQRYPSHLQRVLQPAHEMLLTAGLVRDAKVHQQDRVWFVDYVLAVRTG
jgi:plasmid replication initiation protein